MLVLTIRDKLGSKVRDPEIGAKPMQGCGGWAIKV